MRFKSGFRFKTDIRSLDSSGLGICTYQDHPIHVYNALPDETLEIEITYRKSGKRYGKIATLIKPSPLRQKSACPHFPECGGCQWIDIDYGNQIQLKTLMLSAAIQEAALSIDSLPIIPSQNPLFYRNKMEYAVDYQDHRVIIGLKKRGCYSTIIETPECRLQSETGAAIIRASTHYFNHHQNHTGLLRFFVIRESKTLHQFMLNIVVHRYETEDQIHLQGYAEFITQQFPDIKTIIISINDQIASVAYSENQKIILGDGYITEKFTTTPNRSLLFKISPISFFQTNTLQALVLYQKIRDCVKTAENHLLLDLYCGTGTIGLMLSDLFHSVIGIEENASAISDAKQNANANAISNIQFYTGRVKNILKFNSFQPDCIIIDPPRSGIVPKALARLIALNASQLIYVSCNPKTLLENLKPITEAGYTIDLFQPVDMYPNTTHLEAIVLLTKSQ